MHTCSLVLFSGIPGYIDNARIALGCWQSAMQWKPAMVRGPSSIASWGSFSLLVVVACTSLDPGPSAAAAAPADEGDLAIDIDTRHGDFNVSIDGTVWFVGKSPAFHVDGSWHFESDGSLVLLDTEETHGTDAGLGSYRATTMHWEARTSSASAPASRRRTPISTTFKAYTNQSLLAFSQYYPEGANNTALGTALSNVDEVIGAFPRFNGDGGRVSDLGLFAPRQFWDLDMLGIGLSGFRGGLYGGVPMAWYDRRTLRTVVLSPLENFKSTVQSTATAFGDHDIGDHHRMIRIRNNGTTPPDLACGPHGRLVSIPPGWRHTTIMVAGQGVVPTVVDRWGSLLLSFHNKTRTAPDGGGVINRKLGYMTDTGQFYWYNHGTYTNPLEAMRAVYTELMAARIPVGWFEFDSWWYYKGTNGTAVEEDGGIYEWTPREEVFGPGGMAAARDAVGGLPLVTHAKYYTGIPGSVYEQKDGYPFLSEPNASLPLSQEFWDMLLAQAAGWGVHLFEQDWLASVYELMLRPSQDVHTIANFHRSLGKAAERAGVPVQLCMPLVGDVLQSVESSSMRFIRVSDDYCTKVDQWRIGRASVIPYAVGLIPFKDGFWSSRHQPGFKSMGQCYTNSFEENNPALQATVAVLSGGPVAMGDKVGVTNATLMSRTCLGDGTLFRPERPAMPIEATFLAEGAPEGDVWHTTATISTTTGMGDINIGGGGIAGRSSTGSGVAYGYVFAANLSAPYELPLASAIVGGLGVEEEHTGEGKGVWYAWDASKPTAAIETLVLVDATHPLSLPVLRPLANTAAGSSGVSSIISFGVWVLSPVLQGGWVFLGERNKIMPISSQRFHHLATNGSVAHIGVTLVSEEKNLTVFFLSPPADGGRKGVLLSAQCSRRGAAMKQPPPREYRVQCLALQQTCVCEEEEEEEAIAKGISSRRRRGSSHLEI